MLLHHQFIDIAKQYKKKLAINDLTTNRELTYSKSLIASLILCRFFSPARPGFYRPYDADVGRLHSCKNSDPDEWPDPGYDQLFDRSRV